MLPRSRQERSPPLTAPAVGSVAAHSAAVTVTVLVAAVLHAVWNALLKNVDDRLAGFTLIDLTGMALSTAAVPFLPVPQRASWGFLALSVALQAGYKIFLMGAYRLGDLSHVYPVARGIAPLLVAVLATLAGERLHLLQLAGLTVTAAGLLSLSIGRGALAPRRRGALGMAIVTGVLIAAYTICDGLGARRSGTALGYIAWLFLLTGAAIPGYAVFTRGRRLGAALRAHLAAGLLGGVLSIVAYGLVVWAQTRGTLAAVAALRETSVIVAAGIGAVYFGERFGRRRVLAATLVAIGVIMLRGT
jgi:drug/metabolite transporter (DMT)-like permease